MMKAVLALCCLAAYGLLPSAGVDCPSGALVNGTRSNITKQCNSSCFEYQCGGPEVLFGCKEEAIDACSTLQDAANATGGCKTDADGTFFYFCPACQANGSFVACNGTPKFETFKKTCQEVSTGQPLNNETTSAPALNKTSCPRINGTQNGTVECPACVTYHCLRDEAVDGSGCAADFERECSEFVQEVNHAQELHNLSPSRMYYCNANISFHSACQGESNWTTCMAPGSAMKTLWDEEEATCKSRNGTTLYGPLPAAATTTTQAPATQPSTRRPQALASTFTPVPFLVPRPSACHRKNSIAAESEPCSICAMYSCNTYVNRTKVPFSAMGCFEDFVEDCWMFQQEINEIKNYGPQKQMYFCNQQLEFYSGCDYGLDGYCNKPNTYKHVCFKAMRNICKKRTFKQKFIGEPKEYRPNAGDGNEVSLMLLAAAPFMLL